ncbi:tetratricopeptide repeat protein [Shewanella youngdeokensis]|uniref:Tetratricopeptide repeat protein n=1 Tax=Shewanella youngdeokensis TaxID=2999068 RepID=A0ABZ0JWN7_9GAMM|nr:tetratricopeptide repeat protein [Shewanella sp. DAU334]
MVKVCWSLVLLLLMFAPVSHARDLTRYESGKLSKASELLEQNDIAAAMVVMQPLLELESPHPVVFQYACRNLGDNGAEREAEQCWARGYKLYPNDINIAINLANANLQAEAYQAAIDVLTALDMASLAQKSAKQASASIEQQRTLLSQVRYMQGYAHYQLTQYQAALAILLEGELKPHWWPLVTYSQLALEQWSNAKQSAQQWLALDPINQTAWQVLARSEMGLNNPLNAAVANDIVAQLSPQKTPTNISLLGNLKAYNFAAQCTQKPAVEAFSQLDLSCAQYAWLAGLNQQAAAYLQRFEVVASSSNPNPYYDDYYLLQGQVLAALKQADAARSAWSKVGLQVLPMGSAAEIKHARQKRNQLSGQALLLTGQSYWLAQQWPEAQASYRKLAQTPGFETIAKAFGQRLDAFGMLNKR